MNNAELKTALFTIGLFGAGAVALILYQHASHTTAIMAAVAPPPASGIDTANATGPSVAYASLAGQPTPGQGSNTTTETPTLPAYQVGPGYRLQ